MRSIAYLVIVGAIIHLLAFWAPDLIRCTTAASGCEVRGDLAPMLLVVAGFLVVTVLSFIGYFLIVKRLVNRQRLGRVAIFVTALTYSLAFGFLALELLGIRAAFWMNALVGSAVFSAWCVFWVLHRKPSIGAESSS
jgi:hypothetical protein